jgi:hypothetical protein
VLRYALDLLVALSALALVVVCVALTLASCSSPTGQPALAQRIVAAEWEGWERAGLPEIDEDNCQTERFEVRFATAAEFNRLCRPATHDKQHACFRWLLVEHRAMQLYSIRKPVAIISPTLPEGAYVEGLALHELTHGLTHCVLYRGDYDYHHTDARIWERKGTPVDAAEEYAREALAR